MRYLKSLILFVVIGSPLVTCSPECENITGVYFDDYPYIAEGQILVKANNINTLEGKNVFFDEKPAPSSEFRPGVGLIVDLPAGVTGDDVKMRIQDIDCADFVSTSLSVQQQSYFANNANYIAPAPPTIIIPIPNPPLPPSINNAWISPDNKDYCLWFVVDEVPGSPGNFIISPVSRPNPANPSQMIKSQELSVSLVPACNLPPTEATLRYHGNPMYGMISKSTNKIQFWIDRSAKTDAGGKSLGIEEFEGQFIDITETRYKDDIEIGPPNCHPSTWLAKKDHMMMVVSKQTKRTLVLYQQLTK